MPRALAIFFLATQALCFNSFCASVFGIVATGPSGSNAQAVHALGDSGAGVNIGLISARNTLATHEAFLDADGISHVVSLDATNDGHGILTTATYQGDLPQHDTWIAGPAISRGSSSHPFDIGVAPDANLYNERVVDADGIISTAYLDAALYDLTHNYNCHVIFTGFQLGDTANGSSQWSLLYDYYADKYNVVFANPAGNYNGSIKNISVFGDAYNGITTGGIVTVEPSVWRKIGAQSNLGLTADGRRKPDIAAPSQNQTMPDSTSSGTCNNCWLTWTSTGGETSFSTPHAAGVAALLIAYTNSISEPNYNEVIRAIIINSTFPNIKDNNGVSTAGQLFNVARGYGRVDALRAYQTLAAGSIIPSGHTTAMKGWAYENVRRLSSPDTYFVMGTQNQRLLVTLAWNRTFVSKYTPNPLANLNLTVIDPNGTFTRFSDIGTKDNLKKCDILLPYTGEYQIRIAPNTSLDPAGQNYGLAFELLPPLTGDFDLNYIVDFNDLSAFADEWLSDGPGLTADLSAPIGHIDFADLAVFAQNWLTTNNAYYAGY